MSARFRVFRKDAEGCVVGKDVYPDAIEKGVLKRDGKAIPLSNAFDGAEGDISTSLKGHLVVPVNTDAAQMGFGRKRGNATLSIDQVKQARRLRHVNGLSYKAIIAELEVDMTPTGMRNAVLGNTHEAVAMEDYDKLKAELPAETEDDDNSETETETEITETETEVTETETAEPVAAG